MANATFHKRKLYIPREIEDTLNLSDGDCAEIQVLDDRSFKVLLTSRARQTTEVERRMIDRIIRHPFASKITAKHLKRSDYYDD